MSSKESMKEVIVLQEKMLSLIVCAAILNEDDYINEADLTLKVNQVSPCGTSLGWVISDRSDRVLDCDKHPDRKHWLFIC